MVLSRILSLAVDDELIPSNPCSRVKRLKVNNERIRYLTIGEETKLLKELEHQPQTRNIVIIALHTGMRRGEIFNLKWPDVDFVRKIINVIQTKNNKPRAVPMNPIVLQILTTLHEKDGSAGKNSFVFPSEKTGRRLNNIRHSFYSALRRAYITDFRFHDLRHSAGTRLADAGVHPRIIMEILGHSDLRTTQRYMHAIDSAKREAVARLAEKSTLEIANIRIHDLESDILRV
jgi:integrase